MQSPLERRRFLSLAALSLPAAAGCSRVPTNQQSCPPTDFAEWVARSLQELETIKVGMTRKELLAVFTSEGGLSTGLQQTYVSRDCPYFKVDVRFEAVGRPSHDQQGRVTLLQDDRDTIAELSRPYLQSPVMD